MFSSHAAGAKHSARTHGRYCFINQLGDLGVCRALKGPLARLRNEVECFGLLFRVVTSGDGGRMATTVVVKAVNIQSIFSRLPSYFNSVG